MQAGKRFGTRLGAALVLLFYAHLMTFLYSSFLLAAAAIAALAGRWRARASELLHLGRGLGVAAAMVAVFVGPYAAGIALVGREFDLDQVRRYRPQSELRPL